MPYLIARTAVLALLAVTERTLRVRAREPAPAVLAQLGQAGLKDGKVRRVEVAAVRAAVAKLARITTTHNEAAVTEFGPVQDVRP